MWQNFWNPQLGNIRRFKTIKRLYTDFFKKFLIRKMLFGFVPLHPAILELGAGTGVSTMNLVNDYKGHATLIDSSPLAYVLFRIFHPNSKNAKYLIEDVFNFETEEKYDLVHSDGLIEHFQGEQLDAMVQKHKQFLKPTGYALIMVPRKGIYYLVTYALAWFLKKVGTLTPKEETRLYTPNEMKKLCERNGLDVVRLRTDFKYVACLCQPWK